LGSVYESLLELTPRLTADGRGFAFAEAGEAKGNARKTTGSYYTPDSLVQTLLDSALDPVLDRVEAEADDPDQALLSVTVIDPACGSGHFLLSAARRIAARVARHRTGGVASADDYRHALREVVRACIHGVDRNPLAVELTKVALWIETVEPGKPLGFLDANIRCGDSLLGVFDLDALRHGIPDAAYKPLTGVLGWRDITSAHVLRTVIATAFPRLGVGNSLPLMLFGSGFEPQKLAALIGSLSSMTCDFSARHKVGGTHLNYFIYQQLPVLPPSAYTAADFACLVPRVLELTYTSHSMAPFARDLGYDGPPFVWDEDRRAQLRAELDAWYARAYGLTRNELRYILDPADVRGPDYPSETFRVLKNNEKARWGEYRTGRLVLAAWDAQEARPAAAQ
jgi:hypothetical protein